MSEHKPEPIAPPESHEKPVEALEPVEGVDAHEAYLEAVRREARAWEQVSLVF
jgi:hypothetical protein